MNFSQITDDLFIGTTPSVKDYDILREMGVRLVINMRFTYGPRPDRHVPPLLLLWLRTIDSPFFPIPVAKLILGARTALEMIRVGGRVYVHCAYGRHRGPAMGSCILIAQGYGPESAMKLIMAQRLVANPNAYYIRPRILQFARQWNSA
ncbi:MAG TPA: dual specificity protein phosphatase [Anaerolineales bacterium]|nr:dual specificity protein phosphatase [Anaerolineales bacterium]